MSKYTTAVPLTSLSQPTPEREANLEENMMTHSKVNSILMGEDVEGLMSEVQREREKYPSLLEENRLLEETQMRMTELAISPGPPPPQLTTIFSGSQLGKLNGLHTTLDGASSGVSYSCDSQAVVLWCRLF